MKPIADIRVYREGPCAIDDKPLHLALHKVTIRARKSSYTAGMEPLVIEY